MNSLRQLSFFSESTGSSDPKGGASRVSILFGSAYIHTASMIAVFANHLPGGHELFETVRFGAAADTHRAGNSLVSRRLCERLSVLLDRVLDILYLAASPSQARLVLRTNGALAPGTVP